MQSPNACNRQSYHFRLYDDPEMIGQLAAIDIGGGGYQNNISCLAVLVGKQRAYFNDRDKHARPIERLPAESVERQIPGELLMYL